MRERLQRQRRNAELRKEIRRYFQRGGVLSVAEAREKILRKKWVEILPLLRKHAKEMKTKWKKAQKLQKRLQHDPTCIEVKLDEI